MSKHNIKIKTYSHIKTRWPTISRYLYLRNNSKKVTDNSGLYHYAGNNPVRYMDPDGREDVANNEDFMDTGVYIINGHKKTPLEKIDDEISRFAYRNIIEGGAYNADGSGNKWIRTMRGDMITLSRSGEKYFSNSEKNTDRFFFILTWFASELGLLFKMYPATTAGTLTSTGAASNTLQGIKLNTGAQGKHIVGHQNYIQGRSIFNGSMDDAQRLLNKFAGTGQKISDTKERVNFRQIIGTYIDNQTGKQIETSWGIIHNGNKGSHIVPCTPYK